MEPKDRGRGQALTHHTAPSSRSHEGKVKWAALGSLRSCHWVDTQGPSGVAVRGRWPGRTPGSL